VALVLHKHTAGTASLLSSLHVGLVLNFTLKADIHTGPTVGLVLNFTLKADIYTGPTVGLMHAETA
jgi:hypothetical protein